MLKKVLFSDTSRKADAFSFLWWFIVLFCNIQSIQAVMDNRFRDDALMRYPLLVDDQCCAFRIQPFLETANNSFNEYGKKAGLFDYATPYYLRDIELALLDSGRITERLLPTNMQGAITRGPYLMNGRIETQGLAYELYAPLNDWFAVGMRGEFLHSNSRMEMEKDIGFETYGSGIGDDREVFLVKEKASEALGLDPALWSAFMVGDAEVYARIFTSYDHRYKCRYFNVGASLGFILPAAAERNINNPASIPLGGNRHWGVFGELTLDATLKQDIKAGLWARLVHRFSRESEMRVPTAGEPIMFGAVVGQIAVDPGLTAAFSPYVVFEELREGFGIYLSYMMIKHKQDCFFDRRANKSVPINFDTLTTDSAWGLEYVSVAFLYDFSYGQAERGLDPIVSFKIDVPVDWLIAKRASKTYGVSLSIEASF